MRRIRGVGGVLFSVSERAPLNVPLVDSGNGFDWRSEAPWSVWEPGVAFHRADGALAVVTIEETHGTVGFGKCLSGQQVWAQGWFRPVSVIAEGTAWDLVVPIGGGGTCDLHDWLMEEKTEGSVLVHLPFAGGVLRAFGRLLEPVADQPLRVDLESEVRHGGSV